jgi:hypothetical protein
MSIANSLNDLIHARSIWWPVRSYVYLHVDLQCRRRPQFLPSQF